MKQKGNSETNKTKKTEDDELEKLFETFDRQFEDIEKKFEKIEKEIPKNQTDEEESSSEN